MKRKGISKKLRFEIFERDKFICQYCGRTPDKENVVLQVDHIVSVKNGGENNKDNLITACFDCNIGKGAKTTIKGKMTPEDIKEELSKTQDRLEQVVAMNNATKKISKINKKIDHEKIKWIEEELGYGYNIDTAKEICINIKRSFPDVEREKIIEAINITKERHEKSEFDGVTSFVKYFSGVLRNISLSKEDQDILRIYNNYFYSKSCKMYLQTRKFVLSNSFYGCDFHSNVVSTVDEDTVRHRGKTFKLRDEIQGIFNKTEFTIYNSSELNLNLHICDTLQMLIDENK